ncbi:DsbA family protein [Marinobacter confluentis]|uniref:DsbA family protein n=1 Tax=Marinobacter confluentis TaxID=1697557 RepID=A0A4Z1C9N1_9GAMM|nr:thioredoxin domain-containing protein [Marinobacter confluentis]TGN40353.1 DsbA family protein [Marinobacter confluentis]
MGEAKRRQKTGQPAPKSTGNNQKPLIIALSAGVIALIIGIVYIITAAPDPTSESLPTAGPNAAPFPEQVDQFGVSVGDPDAPVVVREFADYQCPACKNFASASQRLKEEYVASGQVRFVFFDLPLQQHDNAVPAALAARCAGDQDSYWAMHDTLFDKQLEWSGSGSPTDTFTRYAEDLGLEARRFRRCMETDLHIEEIEQSRRVAMQLQLTSTPTVLVDNIRLTRPGWGQLSAVVERELSRQ